MKLEKKGIFVSGTDTNIGKTVVSSLLISSLKRQGIQTGYFKPIQTGIASTDPADRDTVGRLSSLEPQELAESAYVFPEPIAPSQAAQIHGEQIQMNRILHCWETLPPRFWVVEGAGGILVPLNSKETMRDLVQALKIPLLVVASTRLGTINHTLLTLEVALTAGIQVLGVVLVGEADPRLKKTLQDFTDVPILSEVPWWRDLSPEIIEENCSSVFPADWLNSLPSRRGISPAPTFSLLDLQVRVD